jgi:hypothetical protein
MKLLSPRISFRIVPFLVLFAIQHITHADEIIGKRPYEMDWANRSKDIYPPLVDFENLQGWKVQTENAVATFASSREQQLWGDYVGKLTYRAIKNSAASVRVLPPAPIFIANPRDAFSCWVYGNNFVGRDPSTPPVSVDAIFLDSQGKEIAIRLTTTTWKEWFVPYHVLTDSEKKQLSGRVLFDGFRFSNISNKQDRILYFDNFATFQEKLPPLDIPARPKRGINMLSGEGSGFNTGAEQLPFPDNIKTILPDNGTDKFTTKIHQDKSTFIFEYHGDDGNLTYRLEPRTGTWSDISAQWNSAAPFHPLQNGGVSLWVNGNAVAPQKATHKSTFIQGDKVISNWTVSADGVSQNVTYEYRLWNKSLVIDTISQGGNVAEVSYGHAAGISNPRLVWNPYMTYNTLADRPGVVVMGTEQQPLFLAGNTDWYLSNASIIWGKREIDKNEIFYNGGTRYIPKTDGKRNDCYERLFVTIAPRYNEVLPNIPNPKSPWMKVTATRAWTVRGSSTDRKSDYDYFTKLHRYGIRNLIITDHETMWRDGEESFTFRTAAAPGKGGDKGEADYSRFLQDKLGFIYGPYNNYTDFAPVNQYWTPDLINRTADGQLQTAWRRCYAPKPSLAVDYAEKLAPIIQSKFHFSTAYCDVHTAVTPWNRTDYDARVPGAGTFADTFYSYGEIMLLQKEAWNGPVYSEGGHHWFYSGLTDGNYGQDQHAELYKNPWLVNFDLQKIHPLNNNFGMGSPSMFWGRDNLPTNPADYDRFFAAEIAFGHTSFLISLANNPTLTLRSYYMPLALHSRYAQANVKSIQYADEKGNLYFTSRALENGAYKNSQIVTHYDDGTVTVVNGNTDQEMQVQVDGKKIVLPPNGYTGWSSDGKVYVYSGNADHHRVDYSVNEKYFYVDGRGKFTRFPKAASDGQAICRILENNEFEIIPIDNADCGFAITADSVVALDEAGKEMGAAQTRVSRGLTYISPVKGAFSYRVKGSLQAPKSTLRSEELKVLPGQKVAGEGGANNNLQIPNNAKPGTHLWMQSGDQWIDFQVIPLTNAALSVADNKLHLQLQSNLEKAASFDIHLNDQQKVLSLQPDQLGTVDFDLGQPTQRENRLITLTIQSGEVQQTLQRVLLSEQNYRQLLDLPTKWESGMRLRGKEETAIDPQTHARANPDDALSCGGVIKGGIFMHPPYQDAVGYTFIKYDPVTLPAQPAMFRASAGKEDGGFPGDGIWFKVAVIENGKQITVGEETVKDFEWKTIEADLSPWAGKTIQIELISDPGPADNTEADWACWADMRIESKNKVWARQLSDDLERYGREPGPFPIADITTEQLRSAKTGWLHYEGLGLSGGDGEYGSSAILNGIKIGPMAPAGGQESKGVWADAKVLLTPQAIANFDQVNHFVLDNFGHDYFAVRRFWIELHLADGRKISSQISTASFTQPPSWPYGAGIKVPMNENIETDIVF